MNQDKEKGHNQDSEASDDPIWYCSMCKQPIGPFAMFYQHVPDCYLAQCKIYGLPPGCFKGCTNCHNDSKLQAPLTQEETQQKRNNNAGGRKHKLLWSGFETELTNDNEIITYGSHKYHEFTLPEEVGNIVHITAGYYQVVLIDGTCCIATSLIPKHAACL